MKYKLIAVDMDGTLLNSEHKLTEITKTAILQTVAKGIIFTISTGRPMKGVQNINDMFDVDLPFIIYNGAVVIMGKSGIKLLDQKLPAKYAKEIIELGEGRNTNTLIWIDDSLYTKEFNKKTDEYQKISGVRPILIEDIDELIKDGVTKILWFDEIENIPKYQAEMQSHFAGKVNCHASRPMFLEFVDINASKALAMQKIGEHYGISQSEMIAIGDGYNDCSMIEYAGLGIAMGNAPQVIKDIANFVTLSNDQDGVAYAINKFIN